MKCEICNKELKTFQGLAKHISTNHNITTKEYYDKFLKKKDEGICPVCRKSTPFLKLSKGYQKHCCARCAQLNPNTPNTFRVANPQKNKKICNKTQETLNKLYGGRGFGSNSIQNKAIQTRLVRYGPSNKEIKANITKYCKEHNLVNIEKAFNLNYNCGWIDNIELIVYYGKRLIKKSDLDYIKNYKNNPIDTTKITNAIKEVYNGPIENLYIPNLNIAVKYHNNYEIAIESGKDKDFILNQSLLYREKGCRLIHIFEFEDMNKQIYLLKELIKGNDLYNKNDFNKNNFILIPKPQLIYISGTLTIYGAGELYN